MILSQMQAVEANPIAGSPSSSLGDWIFDNLEAIGLGILAVAAFFPAGAPTVSGTLDPNSYQSLWNLRLGPANVFEIALLLFGLLWAIRAKLSPRPHHSAFEQRILFPAVLLIAAFQVVALTTHLADAHYLPLDLERLLIPVAAYLVVTRCASDLRQVRRFAIVVGWAIALRALELVVVYGILGSTQFGTSTGHTALLITEDVLLILFPLMLAWGGLVDGRQRLPAILGTLAFLAAVFAINLISLRRGALLTISSALLLRAFTAGGRKIAMGFAALLVVAAIAVAAGPARSLVHDVGYTAASSTLSTADASSEQRVAEIESFKRNMHDAGWLVGNGIGVLWKAEVYAPVDALSFGSGETELTRIGWHVYGLDWLYKFGLLGALAILWVSVALFRRARSAYKSAGRDLRWLLLSAGICVPYFAIFVWTNPRIGLLLGIVIGITVRCCDLAPGGSDSARPTAQT